MKNDEGSLLTWWEALAKDDWLGIGKPVKMKQEADVVGQLEEARSVCTNMYKEL
jgi:hypothetical protein